MNELSMYILDLVQNSFKANAKNVLIKIEENTVENIITIIIEDDGDGMSDEMLEVVESPFTTSRTTRDVGLGIPLFKQAIEQANGKFEIKSKLGEYTSLKGTAERDNIDLVPLGDIADTLYLLTTNAYDCNIEYLHIVDDKQFKYSRKEIFDIVGEDIYSNYDVIIWIKNYIKENVKELYL